MVSTRCMGSIHKKRITSKQLVTNEAGPYPYSPYCIEAFTTAVGGGLCAATR